MNIANRKVADKCINVVDAVSIGEEKALDFVKSLPDGFHNRLKNRVKTMETMQRGVVVGERTVYDMEAVYINLTTVFECAVPPSIIDEFGILRKVKAQLMKNLVIVSTEPSNPDYVIVAAGQLLYHIVWPSDGTASNTNPSKKLTVPTISGFHFWQLDYHHRIAWRAVLRRVTSTLKSQVSSSVTPNSPFLG